MVYLRGVDILCDYFFDEIHQSNDENNQYCRFDQFTDIVRFTSGSGTRNLIKDADYLKRFQLNPERQIICSMCSGALILALLDGLTATTYPTVVETLQTMRIEVVFEPLVAHGNIATSADCLAAVDLVG